MPVFEIKGDFLGYNSSKDIQHTPMNLLREINNMYVENGILKKRPPFYKNNFENTSSERFIAIHEYYYTVSGYETTVFVTVSKTGLIQVFDKETGVLVPGGTFPLIISGILQVDFFEWNRILYIVAGDQGPYKFYADFDLGTQTFSYRIERISVSKPVVAMSWSEGIGIEFLRVLSEGSGLWGQTGDYGYYYTYVIRNDHQTIESNPSPVFDFSITDNAYLGNAWVFRFPVPNVTAGGYGEITHIKVYRKTPTTADSYYLIGEIDPVRRLLEESTIPEDVGYIYFVDCGDQATNAEYTIARNDMIANWDYTIVPGAHGTQIVGAIGSQIEPIFTNSVWPESEPLSGIVLTRYKQAMLWGTKDGQRIYWTDLNRPEGFDLQNWRPIGELGEKFIKLITLPNFALIVKERTMWTWEGLEQSEFRHQKVADFGSLAPNATFYWGGLLYFINEGGIFRSSLYDTPTNIGKQIWEEVIQVYKRSTNFTESIKHTSAVVDRKTGFIYFNFVTVTGSDVVHNKTFIYNPDANIFVGKINPSIINLFNVGRKGGEQFICSYQHEEGENGYFFVNDPNYFSNPINEDAIACFDETGMMLPKSEDATKKVFKLLKIQSIPLDTDAVNEAEDVSISGRLYDGTGFQIVNDTVGGVQSDNTPYSYEIISNISRTSYGLALRIQSTGLSNSAIWGITGIKLEYEPIGNY